VGPILDSVWQIAEDDFFSGIEISRINDAALRKQVAHAIAGTHLRVDLGAHPIILGDKLNLNSLDSGERNKASQELESYLDQAAEIGARRFVILSSPDPGAAARAQATEALAESLCKLCMSAAQRRLSVVLETFDREVDKKALIGPAAEAAAIAVRIKRDFPDFGLLYDMSHMVLLGETPVQALGKLSGHLAHVHVGKCVDVPGRPSYGDFHPRFGFPGSVNDVPELVESLDALFEIGYLREGPPVGHRPGVGFEVRPQPGESSALILANLKRAWREAWPSVENNRHARKGSGTG
jgi:sugar phosphate isomerase/epimerase